MPSLQGDMGYGVWLRKGYGMGARSVCPLESFPVEGTPSSLTLPSTRVRKPEMKTEQSADRTWEVKVVVF